MRERHVAPWRGGALAFWDAGSRVWRHGRGAYMFKLPVNDQTVQSGTLGNLRWIAFTCIVKQCSSSHERAQ